MMVEHSYSDMLSHFIKAIKVEINRGGANSISFQLGPRNSKEKQTGSLAEQARLPQHYRTKSISLTSAHLVYSDRFAFHGLMSLTLTNRQLPTQMIIPTHDKG